MRRPCTAEPASNGLELFGLAAATANNTVEHEMLFRIGIVCDLLTGVIGLFLALAVYRLFKAVDKNLAVLMVILGG